MPSRRPKGPNRLLFELLHWQVGTGEDSMTDVRMLCNVTVMIRQQGETKATGFPNEPTS